MQKGANKRIKEITQTTIYLLVCCTSLNNLDRVYIKGVSFQTIQGALNVNTTFF